MTYLAEHQVHFGRCSSHFTSSWALPQTRWFHGAESNLGCNINRLYG